jgi:hypothetical protein
MQMEVIGQLQASAVYRQGNSSCSSMCTRLGGPQAPVSIKTLSRRDKYLVLQRNRTPAMQHVNSQYTELPVITLYKHYCSTCHSITNTCHFPAVQYIRTCSARTPTQVRHSLFEIGAFCYRREIETPFSLMSNC